MEKHIQSLIKDNYSLIGAGIFIMFFIIVSNKNNYERFVGLILDCIAISGQTILNILESLFGMLSPVEDFFEALKYVLFGNFTTGIRFIMANYIVLFASIVSFLTTLWGLLEILNLPLSITLSFAIQTVIVLMSLYLAQQFWGERIKSKKIIEYYLKTYHPILDTPCLSMHLQEENTVSKIKHELSKLRIIPCMIITISSMLTYVYLYKTKLDEYIVYKTAYDIIEEIEKDTAENIEKLDNYSKYGKEILLSFWEKAGQINEGSNSTNVLLDYLNSEILEEIEGERKNADEIFQNFQEYMRRLEDKPGDNGSSLFLENISDNNSSDMWDENNVQLVQCAFKDDLISLVRNILDLKLYLTNQKKLSDIEVPLTELREYLVKEAPDLQSKHTDDKQVIREKVQEIILYESELYANVPILQDIQIVVVEDGSYQFKKWMKPVKRGFATKYEHYLEIADTRLLVAGRAFDALLNMNNIFLWCMFALSFIADLLILITSFVRAKQEARKSNRIKQNLVHSIFIKQLSKESIYNTATIILSVISIIGLAYIKYISVSNMMNTNYIIIVVGLCICGIIIKIVFSCITKQSPQSNDKNPNDKRIIEQVMTKHGLKVLEYIELKKVLKEIYILWMQQEKKEPVLRHYQSAFIERQIETARCQEFYVDCNGISQADFNKEIILLCSVELAYPAMDEVSQVKGYIITKECIRLLIKEMFDVAKKNGLNIRMFKEDLKEYEEDIWN